MTHDQLLSQGTGPWNLEVQVVDPKGSETLLFTDLQKSPMTLDIPIPKTVDRDGGTFDIDLCQSILLRDFFQIHYRGVQ